MNTFILSLNDTGCVQKCIFCSSSLQQRRQAKQDLASSTGLAKNRFTRNLLSLLGAEYGCARLVITGNEPTTDPRLPDIMRLARNLGFRQIVLKTDAASRLGDGDYLKKLCDAGLTRCVIPIYGVEPAAHDRITGARGSYVRLLKALENIKKYKIDLVLNSVTLRQNLSQIPGLIGKFKINYFVFPHHDHRRLDYADFCPRISSVAELIKGYGVLRLNIPCLRLAEYPVQWENGYQGPADRAYKACTGRAVRIFELKPTVKSFSEDKYRLMTAKKCRSCGKKASCTGIYAQYLDLFGDAEFNPIA